MSASIHQEIVLNASASRIFSALTNATEFSAFSGEPAEIDSVPGGVVSCFGGKVTGRVLEVVPDQRLVQAWRVGAWDAGVYSVVRFELKAGDSGSTTVVLDHGGFPEAFGEHLEGGWHKMYWEPLQPYLAQGQV